MRQTRQLDNITDRQKDFYINDLPYFGWNIDNVQKVDNTKMHVEKNLLSKDLKIENNYYWTITISRDTNMPNFSKLNSLFEEYIELRSDHEENLSGQSFKIKKISVFASISTVASIIGFIAIFVAITPAFFNIILIVGSILLFILGLILSIVLRIKVKKERKLLTSLNDDSKIKDLLEEACSILDSI